jgi:hypothetical protein
VGWGTKVVKIRSSKEYAEEKERNQKGGAKSIKLNFRSPREREGREEGGKRRGLPTFAIVLNDFSLGIDHDAGVVDSLRIRALLVFVVLGRLGEFMDAGEDMDGQLFGEVLKSNLVTWQEENRARNVSAGESYLKAWGKEGARQPYGVCVL